MSNFIYEVINQKINSLKSFYFTHKNIVHSGVKGTLNEILLQELIKEIIPTKYQITKGIVQDYIGIQSNESDIIIYNPEILPSFLFGNNLGITPAEAARYVFEVKSTLNATELQSTIKKFKNLKALQGFKGSSALFAFDSDMKKDSNEFKRYIDYDKSFYRNPAATILVVANRGYYFFAHSKHFVKESLSKEEVINQFIKKNFDNKITLNVEKITKDKSVVINDVNYDDIYYTSYSWHGIEVDDGENCELLGLLSGISNTLSVEAFGKYLFQSCDGKMKTYSYYIEDMWGNESYKKIDFKGFDNDISRLGLSLTLNQDNNENKIMIYEKNMDSPNNNEGKSLVYN